MVRTSPNSRIRRILAVGRDVSQLSSRANLLTHAGYTTDLVVTIDQAVQRASVGRYHLAIVSPTFSDDEQLAIRARLEQAKPSLPVLLVGPSHDSPEAFLVAVAACLSRNKLPKIDIPRGETRANEFADS